ncbi:MAG: hypothetical protein M3356_00870 [Actinomycetota bacterium]|nr:hypothetical protein [Actinomycetota bacterium]
MTKKADFNADEWARVVEGPMLAGMRVITADRGGTIRESLAMGQVYTRARQQQGGSELLDELVSSPPAMDPERMRTAGDVGRASSEGLREALRLLGEKASPEEVDAYKGFVRDVAGAVARAHKEGGFLGVGGKEVSPEEQAALDEIEAELT